MKAKFKYYEEMSVHDFIKIYPEYWFYSCLNMPEDLIRDLLTDPLYIVRVSPDPDDPEYSIAEFGYREDKWNITA